MSGIYEVYLDFIFLKNLIENIALISCVLVLLDKKIYLKRLLLGAILNSMGTVIFLMYCPKNLLLTTVVILLNAVPGIAFSMKKSTFRDLIYALICYLILSSVHITSILFIKQFYSKYSFVIGLCILGIVLFYLACLKEKQIQERSEIYQVSIFAHGKKIKVDALLDTGNMLREKKTGKMVCIVEKEVVKEILKNISCKEYHYVPFHSVGQEQGILMAISTDYITVTKEEKTRKVYGVLLGLYEGNISSTGKFQMILHGDCLKGRNGYEHYLANLFTQKRKGWSA